jgi:biotin carboxylase
VSLHLVPHPIIFLLSAYNLGGSNNNNYANVDLIVDVAERSGVHAVWAGWGHASENPRLPESLAASPSKIVFIGPPGSAMRSLGDKISSTIVAQSANVPTMPWSGTGITETNLNPAGFVEVPEGAYKSACVTSVEEGLDRAEKIGWPVMIKASEGGGGKGIRKVDSAGAFKNAYSAVAGEVPGQWFSSGAVGVFLTFFICRFSYLYHEACRVCPSPRGSAACRSVRKRNFPFRT